MAINVSLRSTISQDRGDSVKFLPRVPFDPIFKAICVEQEMIIPGSDGQRSERRCAILTRLTDSPKCNITQ